MGHNPVCSWFRPHTSFLECVADSVTPGGWDTKVPANVAALCSQLYNCVCAEDPVQGNCFAIPDGDWFIWCDASNLATGVALQCGEAVIEDGCWLPPKDDRKHINVAKLDSVMSGLQLVTAYGLTRVCLMTDSKAVYGWLHNLLHDICRVKTNGLYNVLVQRRLQAIEELVQLTVLSIDVEWAPYEHNLADVLTRVPSAWLNVLHGAADIGGVGQAGD